MVISSLACVARIEIQEMSIIVRRLRLVWDRMVLVGLSYHTALRRSRKQYANIQTHRPECTADTSTHTHNTHYTFD